MIEVLVWSVVTAFYLAGWVLYLRERGRYRDAATDLCQLMHDHNVDRADLRRTKDHKAVRDWE